MYSYIFKYLKELIVNKNVMIYGNILLEELQELLDSTQEISIVNDNLDELINLKNKFPNLNYNQSLYFIKEKFDFLIVLTDSPINPKTYIKKLGVFINIEFIESKEDYHRIILANQKEGFSFLERVNLYKRDTVISISNNEKPEFIDNNLFLEIPNAVIEYSSDFKLDLKNIVKVL